MTTPSSVYNGTFYEEVVIFELALSTTFAATAFLAYAHLILLGQEVRYIWNRPIGPASCLFLLIRYFALLCQLIGTGINSYTPHCTSIFRLAVWSETIAVTAVYLVLIIRTYAVCGKNRSLAALLLALCLPVLVIDTLISIRVSCTNDNVISPFLENVGNVFDLVFESVVVSSTIWGTWSHVMMAGRSRMSHRTVARSILQNGLVYYSIFLGLQVCYLATYNVKPTPIVFGLNVFVNQLLDPIRFALTCQFLLELRERADEQCGISSMSLSTMSTLHATVDAIQAAIDQDFGEPLVHPRHRMDVEEIDEGAGVGRTGQTETQRELKEGMELRERYLAQVNAQNGVSP